MLNLRRKALAAGFTPRPIRKVCARVEPRSGAIDLDVRIDLLVSENARLGDTLSWRVGDSEDGSDLGQISTENRVKPWSETQN